MKSRKLDLYCVALKTQNVWLIKLENSNSIYDDKFFRKYLKKTQYLNDHKVIASAIISTFRPRSVIDIGCGSGRILHWLRSKNFLRPPFGKIAVSGYEGSESAVKYWPRSVRSNIRVADCTQPLEKEASAVLVVCLEVAEHIETARSEQLVKNLCNLSDQYILFSAAPPGQGGVGHINEQPWQFWVNLFAKFGWEEHQTLTSEFKSRLEAKNVSPWYRENTRVLIRNS